MANINYKHFTLGIEEEYMVVDPESRELKSHQQKIVTEGQKVIKDKVKAEMHQAVVEVGTDICQNIDEAFKDVAILRKTISGIAGDLGFRVGASGTHPFSHWESQLITDHVRYNEIVKELQEIAHVEVEPNQTIICIVGQLPKNKAGYGYKVLEALKDIPLRMVSYGGSANNISVLVNSDLKKDALLALNKGLFNYN